METTVDKAYKEVMSLPDDLKAVLAERIIEYLETNIDPSLEQLHLVTVKRRRNEMRSRNVQPVNGKDALDKARRILNK
ncbi:MAG: addiction module protein [Deltaproteobacteria bacterium]|nr:addiction module protein [Deltaproteobacteria bacterium]